MNRLPAVTAFLVGVIALVWMGASFIGSNALGLAVILVIGAVYTIGFGEMVQFRRATATLWAALADVPADAADSPDGLNDWLNSLHPSLHNAVRLRIEGERAGLPAPVITPYLVGLLVMLGLLGTFAGMVETLRGAVVALEGTTELQAIREGLTAPIKGLGLAFGTSVAGIAASAMLGLVATLSRRDRMLATRRLDTLSSTTFHAFSLSRQRQEAYHALQAQAQALPAVAARLDQLADNLALMGEQLGNRLVANQETFHVAANETYTALAHSVDKSLRDSLAESGRLAGESIAPLVSEAMSGLSRDAHDTQQRLANTAREQLADFTTTVSTELQAFTGAAGEQLSALRTDEERRGAAAVDRLAQLEETVSGHLTRLGTELEEPMARLIATAAETPRAAAEVFGLLRQEISNTLERDNSLLEERRRIMDELNTLSGSLADTAESQRSSIEKLVEDSTGALLEISSHFEAQLATQLGIMGSATDQFSGSSEELASLGEAFSLAVALFSESNQQLIDRLGLIEDAMDRSTSRSDEQMAYYVAQAREIIDQSMLSQREIFEQLQQLESGEQTASAGAA